MYSSISYSSSSVEDIIYTMTKFVIENSLIECSIVAGGAISCEEIHGSISICIAVSSGTYIDDGGFIVSTVKIFEIRIENVEHHLLDMPKHVYTMFLCIGDISIVWYGSCGWISVVVYGDRKRTCRAFGLYSHSSFRCISLSVCVSSGLAARVFDFFDWLISIGGHICVDLYKIGGHSFVYLFACVCIVVYMCVLGFICGVCVYVFVTERERGS